MTSSPRFDTKAGPVPSTSKPNTADFSQPARGGWELQERVDTLMRMLEDKADVSEVTDHLLDIQRAVAAKADRAEKNKVSASAARVVWCHQDGSR